MPRPPLDESSFESGGWKLAYWICQITGWGAYVAAGLSMVLPQAGPQPVILVGYGLFFFYSIAITHVLRSLIRRRGWLGLPPARAVGRLATAAIIVGTVLALLIVLVQAAWTFSLPFQNPPSVYIAMWASTCAAVIGWTVFYVGITSIMRARRARENTVALELDMREARLKALEAQIGPHFLFNCLNSLRGMITENPTEAQTMVTRLANILRHNLARDTAPTESLDEQIAFTKDYLALEKVRFEERLRTRFEIAPETPSRAIPAMLLQTLVENAIKHGIAHLPEGGEISIASQLRDGWLEISVENTGRLTPPAPGSTQVGLANLRERLRVLHGPGAKLEVHDTGRGTVLARASLPHTLPA